MVVNNECNSKIATFFLIRYFHRKLHENSHFPFILYTFKWSKINFLNSIISFKISCQHRINIVTNITPLILVLVRKCLRQTNKKKVHKKENNITTLQYKFLWFVRWAVINLLPFYRWGCEIQRNYRKFLMELNFFKNLCKNTRPWIRMYGSWISPS